MISQSSKKVIISGASGFVGCALHSALKNQGFDVFSLVRRTAKDDREIKWDPYAGDIEIEKLEDTHCVIHLSGESIAARWTKKKKKKIYNSRIASTRFLVESFEKLRSKPKTFLCTSAIGFYGECGDKEVSEKDPLGKGFLASVCKDWEAEAAKATSLGIRTILHRFGVVLSPKGGALKKMLLPFKLGLGGKLGSGNQFMSWIALEDVVSGLIHCMNDESLSGPVNFTAPNPITNSEFTKTLAKALHQPAIFPVPEFVLKIIFGEMADETLLVSQRVLPKKLLESKFSFKYTHLEDYLKIL